MSGRSSFQALFLSYLEYLEVERQVSSYTIRNYAHYLRRFIDWLDRYHRGLAPEKLNLAILRRYRVYLSRYVDDTGKSLSKTTQSYHVIALRSWFKWMIKQDVSVMAPEKIELPKTESRRLDFLSLEQIERLMEQPRIATIVGLRDRAILETLFSTGLRVSELVSLDRDQVNFEKREFGVLGKGKKLRVVFLSERASGWLQRYLVAREEQWKPVFVRHSKRAIPQEIDGEDMRLSTRTIQRVVEKYRKAARLPVPITPHGIRHSFATDLLSKGAGLREVQEMLGHKNVATTQIYTHVTNPQLKKVHDRYHGTDKLEK